MAAFDKVRSGISQLDEILDYIRMRQGTPEVKVVGEQDTPEVGSTGEVESVDGRFEPYEVHYAETFIVPECVGKYRLRAVSGPVKVMQAYVRN